MTLPSGDVRLQTDRADGGLLSAATARYSLTATPVRTPVCAEVVAAFGT